MKKRFLLCGLSAALLFAGCGSGGGKIRFAAAGLGGVYHSFVTSFAQIISEDENAPMKDQIQVKTTAGSAANLRLLGDGYVQLAVAQADQINDAYYGKGIFQDKKYQGYGAVTTLYTEACQIVVRQDSDITSLDGLMGKKVSIGEKESGTEQNALQILQAGGLSSNLLEEVNLNYIDAASQLQSGEIDAFFCTAGVQTTMIEELARQCEIRLLDIDGAVARKLTSAYGFYNDMVIPEGTYSGQTEDVHTLSIQSVLLASDKLSENTVKDLTGYLFQHEQELQYSVPVDLQLNETAAPEGITIPFHPGAVKYYEEQGVSLPDASSDH